MKKERLVNFALTTGSYSTFLDTIIDLAKNKSSAMICVANVHMYIEAQRDNQFLQVINSAEMVTPDGKPLTWALRFLYGIRQDRVAGMDILPDLLRLMALNNISAYFYGSSPSILEKTQLYLKNFYPDFSVVGLHSPPFYSSTEMNETITDEQVITTINMSRPSVVFVVLGCPKQERWMSSMKNRINTVMIGVGGALPVLIGIQKRAPRWMQNYGLEWFFRLMQEPGRLFKRYVSTNRLFIWIIFKEFVKIKLLIPLGLSKIS